MKNGNANDKLDLRTGDKIKISQDLHNEDRKDSRRRKMVMVKRFDKKEGFC